MVSSAKRARCQRQDSPRHAQRVPFEGIEGGKDDNDNQHGEEPGAVHNLLSPIPIAMNDIAIEEEGEIEEQLADAGSIHKLV